MNIPHGTQPSKFSGSTARNRNKRGQHLIKSLETYVHYSTKTAYDLEMAGKY